MWVVAVLGAALATACVVGGSASAAPVSKARITLIGDSVAESFQYVPAARRYLARGLDLRSDAVVCRRLVAASCGFQGGRASTALEVVTSRRGTLGPVVVIDVGYNDWAAVYDVDRLMSALTSARVRRVVWVTLRETTPNYRQVNAAIRRADHRWPELAVADWNAHSRGKPWFRSDGLHLNAAGAVALARFLRPLVLEGLAG